MGEKEKIIIKIDPDIEDIVPAFLQNCANHAKKIEEALLLADFETIHKIGHTMKGNGQTYGFDRISELGTALNQEAKTTARPDEIREFADQLKKYLEQIEVMYEEERVKQ